MYFKSEYLSNISSENVEKVIRSHSLKHYSTLDFKFTSTYAEEEGKYFFGIEKPKTIKITRIRSPFLKYLPKIILKFDKSNFKEYKIRFSAFTFLIFIYSSVALILNLITSINSNNISENLLAVLIGNIIFYSLVFMEYKTTRKKLNSIINSEKKKRKIEKEKENEKLKITELSLKKKELSLKKKEEKVILDFIKHYSENDFKKIIFKWNGKHGSDLIDENNKFRILVCELLKEDFSISSDKLILDLYTELSKRAKETWSVYNNFHLFANEILERNSTKFFDIYFKGATKSMDTGMASGRLNLKSDTINEIVTHIKMKMETNKDDELKNYGHMLERFEYLKSKT